MISRSTRAKRRAQARNLRLSRMKMTLADPRHDFWLVSFPKTNDGRGDQFTHLECYGMKEAAHVYGRMRQMVLQLGG